MKKLIIIVLLTLTACTKEIITEKIVYQDRLVEDLTRINELQSTINNLNATNQNLESQISNLSSQVNLLESDLEAGAIELDEAEDKIVELEDLIEDYNIEVERSNDNTIFRKSFNQLKSIRVLEVEGYRLQRLGVWDFATIPNVQWPETSFDIPDGKEISFSLDGTWQGYLIRFFYDRNGDLSLVVVETDNGSDVHKHFYIEFYDYIYQFEDAIIEHVNLTF